MWQTGWEGMGVWGRMDTCICIAESLCCPPETVNWLYSNTKLKEKSLAEILVCDCRSSGPRSCQEMTSSVGPRQYSQFCPLRLSGCPRVRPGEGLGSRLPAPPSSRQVIENNRSPCQLPPRGASAHFSSGVRAPYR